MNILGAIIGGAIDRRDGDSGVKGALLGSLGQSALTGLVKVGAAVTIGWALTKAFRKTSGKTQTAAR